MKKLPDMEFDIMKVVWANEPPITTNIIMQQLGNEREWKAQAVTAIGETTTASAPISLWTIAAIIWIAGVIFVTAYHALRHLLKMKY